jgi:hypothetical protein
MEISTGGARAKVGENRFQFPELIPASRPALLQWITPHELEPLRDALARGHLPPDFLGKLRGLAAGGLSQRFIEQNCRLFAALLLATEHGSFRQGDRAERERLLRVLAYVRKDEDAIPDFQPEGYTDDLREVRTAVGQLGDLLRAFKAWRLRFQVPAMWQEHGVA